MRTRVYRAVDVEFFDAGDLTLHGAGASITICRESVRQYVRGGVRGHPSPCRLRGVECRALLLPTPEYYTWYMILSVQYNTPFACIQQYY